MIFMISSIITGYISGTYYPYDLSLLAEVGFAKFLYSKVTPLPLSILSSSGRSLSVSHTLKELGFIFHPLRAEYVGILH